MIVSMRRLDDVGRIVIPRELIQRLGWKVRTKEEPGTPLIIEEKEGTIVLRAFKECCLICGGEDYLERINEDDYICSKCLNGLKDYLDRRDG